MGSMLTANSARLLRLSFSAQAQVKEIGNSKQKQSKTKTTLQISRLTLTGMCARVTHSVHLLHKLQEFMLETGHEPESFPDSIIFVSMLNNTHVSSSSGWSGCLRTIKTLKGGVRLFGSRFFFFFECFFQVFFQKKIPLF